MSHDLPRALPTGGTATATSISAAITRSYALMIKIRLHDKLTPDPFRVCLGLISHKPKIQFHCVRSPNGDMM